MKPEACSHLACRVCRNQNPANVRERFLAGYERHLTRFNLRDATTNLSNLCLCDAWRSVTGEALHNAVSERILKVEPWWP